MHCQWPIKAEIEWKTLSLLSKLQPPPHSPTPLLSSTSSWRMNETGPWQLGMETENTILLSFTATLPSQHEDKWNKKISDPKQYARAVCAASLALALGM